MTDGTANHDTWRAGQSYEIYMGRWSREIAVRFLDWLEAPQYADWIDIGCGTGALTETILQRCSPKSVTGVEPSEGFVSHARESIRDIRVSFELASAEQLPFDAASFDISASALVLNFVPDRTKALREMQRVTRKGGQLSFYVWDYPAGGIGFIDEFWKAAAELDPKAEDLDEGKRFPFCTAKGISLLCQESGIGVPSIDAIEIETVFSTFKEFWRPFTLGTGPAPGYYMSLEVAHRNELQKILARNLGPTEPITLRAKAWAAKTIIR